MAELNDAAGANRHKGIARSKKLSTRVDLTPMVDLGFLLITFFIFTTTATEPTALRLYLPKDTHEIIDFTPIRQSTVLTVIPVAGEKVVYYHGDLPDAELAGQHGVTNFSASGGIGNIIRQKQNQLETSGRFKRSDLVVIIRPVVDASYKSIVDALDEMLINQVKHYSFIDITDAELKFLSAHAYNRR